MGGVREGKRDWHEGVEEAQEPVIEVRFKRDIGRHELERTR